VKWQCRPNHLPYAAEGLAYPEHRHQSQSLWISSPQSIDEIELDESRLCHLSCHCRLRDSPHAMLGGTLAVFRQRDGSVGRYLFRILNVAMGLAVRCSPICAASPLAHRYSACCGHQPPSRSGRCGRNGGKDDVEGLAELEISRPPGDARSSIGCEPTTFCAEAHWADPTPGAPREIHMRRIVHHECGEPARALRVEDGPSTRSGQIKFASACLTHRSIQAISSGSWARQRSERRRQSPSVGGYPDLKAPAS
jgi:hypothetical protein